MRLLAQLIVTQMQKHRRKGRKNIELNSQKGTDRVNRHPKICKHIRTTIKKEKAKERKKQEPRKAERGEMADALINAEEVVASGELPSDPGVACN